MEAISEFLNPDNFRYLFQIADIAMLIVAVVMFIVAATRSTPSSRRRYLVGAFICLTVAGAANFAKERNWLPDIPETATPNPAQIQIVAMTTNVTSRGTTEKISITNTGKSKRSVTVTGLMVAIRDIANTQPDASSFRGHGPGAVNELIVVHGPDLQKRIFYIDEEGHCHTPKRTTNNLLDALQKPINLSLAPGESYSLIVHNIAESYGVFETVWRVQYLSFLGLTEAVTAKSEFWGSTGGKVRDDEICMEPAGTANSKQ